MHPQDRLPIAVALVHFVGNQRDLDAREERAWELAEAITVDEGLPFGDSALMHALNRGGRSMGLS